MERRSADHVLECRKRPERPAPRHHVSQVLDGEEVEARLLGRHIPGDLLVDGPRSPWLLKLQAERWRPPRSQRRR